MCEMLEFFSTLPLGDLRVAFNVAKHGGLNFNPNKRGKY